MGHKHQSQSNTFQMLYYTLLCTISIDIHLKLSLVFGQIAAVRLLHHAVDTTTAEAIKAGCTGHIQRVNFGDASSQHREL